MLKRDSRCSEAQTCTTRCLTIEKFYHENRQRPDRRSSNRVVSRADELVIHSPTIPRKTQIMNPALFGVVIIAAQFLLAFVKRPPRLIRDLRGRQDALVEFFARSTESCRVLSVLLAHRKPLRLATIAQEAVLCILQVSGFVRMSRRGFLVTQVGREVHRRIEGGSAISDEGEAVDIFLHDHLMLPEFLILLLFAAR